jgi:hypothetical protein
MIDNPSKLPARSRHLSVFWCLNAVGAVALLVFAFR